MHGMKTLRQLLHRFKQELQLYRGILTDPRTPKLTKLPLGCAVGYAVSPVDFIPDFISVLGHLDDAIIIPILVWLALKSIPRSLLEEHRRKVAEK